ncbi:DMT family transporter [Alsobacter sp. SYSU M60028]|uniref:DMT family transporter n=1 Tax=Alsobacter ponti TaxID=2962936 RepID=A0ABT1LFA9_9HYPH|nr:DMT family transporter [Alsobacter ponti]MCP8940182.1 DMT family transporter [Alsobacter ponti]
MIAAVRAWLSGQAYVLLGLTTFMWAGNAVASRFAVGQISAMSITAGRWAVALAVLVLFTRREIRGCAPELRRQWPKIALMGAIGFTAFNALFYLAGHYTTAVNIAITQGSFPVFVMLGGLLVFGTRPTLMQTVGALVTLVGIAVLAGHGDWERLKSLTLNFGDVLMLVACVFYTAYTLALRRRPALPALVFFTAMAAAAFLTSLPLLAIEMALGATQWPTPTGLATLVFIALFPSLLAQVLFMRGVELIGPSRAGLFMNLTPVFGSILAVVLLGEPFGIPETVALALVLGGIVLAERLGRPRQPDVSR